MKRRICSYDMATVPDHAYVLADAGGELYLCGPRCLALWSMQLVTHPHVKAEQVNAEWTLATPEGLRRRFETLSDLTKWAAANLLSPEEGEWLLLGRSVGVDSGTA